jgi:uncharacterized protein YutD
MDTQNKPEAISGTGNYLNMLRNAAEGFDRNEFQGRFIGVLSCYVPRDVWEYALEAAKDQLKFAKLEASDGHK